MAIGQWIFIDEIGEKNSGQHDKHADRCSRHGVPWPNWV